MGCVLCNMVNALQERFNSEVSLDDPEFVEELVNDIVTQHPDIAEAIKRRVL